MMKSRILYLFIVASTLMILQSCLGDDDNNSVVSYNDTAITGFSLGTLKWHKDSVNASGKDTTYLKSLKGSNYIFSIDQIRNRIYNRDSLPHGTDASRVLITVNTKNSGIVYLKNTTSDTLTYHNNTDSVDFSVPRVMRVYNNTGEHSRDYTINVNVHKEKAEDFTWSKATTNSEIASLTNVKALAAGNYIYIYGSNSSGAVIYSTNINDGKTYNALSPSIGLDVDIYKNVVAYNNTIYALNNGVLYSTTDAVNYTALATISSNGKQLLGVTAQGYYILGTDNKLYIVKRGSTEMEEENLNGDDSNTLPTASANFVEISSLTNNNVSNLVLFGYNNSNSGVVRGKVEENNATNSWMNYTNATVGTYHFPTLQNMSAIVYDRRILAVGGNGVGEDASISALSAIYVSTDGGVTWKANDGYTLPNDTNFKNNTTSFTITADENSYVWIFCGGNGQVWKAKKNRVAWKLVD